MSDATATQYVRSADGTNLAYRVTGDGPLDLMFLTATNFPIDLMWDEPAVVRIGRRLGAFARTIWFDPRGGGASEGTVAWEDAGEIFAADLTAVLDAAGAERVALVGASASGQHAIQFSVSDPERVNALVLLNTYAHYLRHDDYPWGLPEDLMERFLTNVKASWGTGANVEILAPSRAADARFREWWARCQRLGIGPDQLADTVQGSFRCDLRPLLSCIHVPT